ncbi:MAG: hypothetical protein KGL39_44630, partial [Patescibacteria group bacterium]|nr:hypothetical protein [Patescibacteria group bacterium]
GGTTLATNAYQYCGDLATVESLLSAAGNYAELKNMATTFFAQGNAVGLYLLELGVGTIVDDEIAGLQTWITNNPGVFYTYLVPATWDYSKDAVGSVIITNGGSGYTTVPTVTFSAPTSGTTATGTAVIQNGAVVSVTITNPGNGYTAAPTVTFSAPTSGTTATGTANLASAMDIVASDYASPTGKTYFVVTTSSANVANYSTQKSVFAVIPAPTAPASEFTAAAFMYQMLVNSPNAANKLAPMAYRYLYGVTPWVQSGNQTTINTILTAYGNIVLTGAEGGISAACAFKGTTMDGEQFGWWYGIDWVQIQERQALAAAIINGSNSNPPLLYDQTGINALQATAQGIADSAVTFGCVLSAVVTATSFYDYTTANPGDYNAGIYNGLSCTAKGQNGFLTITFNLDAVQF